MAADRFWFFAHHLSGALMFSPCAMPFNGDLLFPRQALRFVLPPMACVAVACLAAPLDAFATDPASYSADRRYDDNGVHPYLYLGLPSYWTAVISDSTTVEADTLTLYGGALLVVNGAGSVLEVSSEFTVGVTGGTSTLIVEDAASTRIIAGSDAWIGKTPGDAGTVLVRGSGTTLTSAASTLDIGYEGTGSLIVSDGAGAVLNVVTLGSQSGSRGTLAIGAAAGETAGTAGTITVSGGISFGDGTGTIVFNHTDDAYVFTPDVSGDGTLAFHAGTTTLTGDYSGFSGTAEIYTNGALNLTSNFTGGIGLNNGVTYVANDTLVNAFRLDNGSTLKGSGTVGALTLGSGSTLAPGNSIGTLTVSGSVSFGSGSVYVVEVDDQGNSDRVTAGGTVTIDSGSTLRVVAENGTDDGSSYRANTDYTIVSGSSLTGGFGTVTENFAFLTASVGYSNTEAVLTLKRNITDFSDKAKTPNQRRVADVIQTMGPGTTLYDRVEALPDGAPAKAFQALTGEIHPSMQGIFISAASIDRAAINARLLNVTGGLAGSADQVSMGFHGDADGSQLSRASAGMWGQGFGGWGRLEGTGETAALDHHGGGFLLGADAEWIQGLRTGIVGGYSRVEIDGGGSATADSYHAGLYAGSRFGPVGVRLGASYTWHDISSERNAVFTGFADRLIADYSASTAQVFGEVGYEATLDRARLEPFAGLALVREYTEGFTEAGGAAALTSRSGDDLVAVSTLGLRGEAELGLVGGFRVTLNGALAWRHAFGDTDPDAVMRFASGSDAFRIDGVPLETDAAHVEAGLSLERDDTLEIGLGYTGDIGAAASDHTGRFSLGYRF